MDDTTEDITDDTIYIPTKKEENDITDEPMCISPIYVLTFEKMLLMKPFYSITKYIKKINSSNYKLLDFKMIILDYEECDYQCGTVEITFLVMRLFQHKNMFVVEISFYFEYGTEKSRSRSKDNEYDEIEYEYFLKKINPISYILPKNISEYDKIKDSPRYSYDFKYGEIHKRLSDIITNHFISHVKDLSIEHYGLHGPAIIDIINKVYIDINIFKKYIENLHFVVPPKYLYQIGGGISNYEIYKLNKLNYLNLA